MKRRRRSKDGASIFDIYNLEILTWQVGKNMETY
jgi:hypothetical protein